ncbi:MAG: GNAT family N-acetyltransferase [Actinomycetota bacterium]
MRDAGRRKSLAVLLGAVAVAIGLVGLTPTPAGAVIEDPDIDSSADHLYTVNFERGVIEVAIEVTITADKPNVTTADSIFQYYFEGYNLLVPDDAEELTVTDGSGELPFERIPGEAGEDSDILEIDFRRNIFYRQSATFTISFVIPAGAAGSDNIARVNPAYASFIAWTSPNFEEATVRVALPPGFEDRSTGPQPFEIDFDSVDEGLVADDLDPETYYAIVSLGNDDALDEEVIQLDTVLDDPSVVPADSSSNVRVLSWPGDDAWRDHVLEGVEVGLPELARLVDRPWPIEEELTILESFAPYLYGYAGWYDSTTDVIEVGDERDEHVLYHEISHVWFNQDMFTDRWITEGLADYYAAETMDAIGRQRPEPPATTTTDLDAIDLSDFDFPDTPEQEIWGYQASWGVMERIADEIGPDGLSRVIAAADQDHIPYTGDGDPEESLTNADWRRFLDLVENEQRVASGPVADLVDEWVLPRGDGPDFYDLDSRAVAREDYFELVEAGGDWAPPLVIRESMTEWRFQRAGELMTTADGLVEERDTIVELVAPTGAALPDDLEPLFEAVDDEDAFDDVGDALAETNDAAAEVRESHDAVEAERSILQRLGLIGADVELEQDQAVAAFSAGELETAISEADEVDEIMDDAGSNGLLRLLAILMFLVILTALAVWLLFLRPRNRNKAKTEESAAMAAPGPDASTAGVRAPEPAMASATATLPDSAVVAAAARAGAAVDGAPPPPGGLSSAAAPPAGPPLVPGTAGQPPEPTGPPTAGAGPPVAAPGPAAASGFTGPAPAPEPTGPPTAGAGPTAAMPVGIDPNPGGDAPPSAPGVGDGAITVAAPLSTGPDGRNGRATDGQPPEDEPDAGADPAADDTSPDIEAEAALLSAPTAALPARGDGDPPEAATDPDRPAADLSHLAPPVVAPDDAPPPAPVTVTYIEMRHRSEHVRADDNTGETDEATGDDDRNSRDGESDEQPPTPTMTLVDPPDPELNRRYYAEVGADYKWTDRADWDSAAWHRLAYAEGYRTWIATVDGEAIGYVELDGSQPTDVEIAYFGLLPSAVGRGLGRRFLDAAIDAAWDTPDVERVWLHTCTDDHPRALPNYLAAGFTVYDERQE